MLSQVHHARKSFALCPLIPSFARSLPKSQRTANGRLLDAQEGTRKTDDYACCPSRYRHGYMLSQLVESAQERES